MMQFPNSIVYGTSAHAAPDSFDAMHVTSSSMKSRGTVLGTFLYSSKTVYVEFSIGWDLRVWVLLLEDLCNRYPGLSASIIRKRKPSPIPVGCLTDGLTNISWHNVLWTLWAKLCPPPFLHWWPYLPWQHLPPLGPPPGPYRDLSPIGQSSYCFLLGSPWLCRQQTSL